MGHRGPADHDIFLIHCNPRNVPVFNADVSLGTLGTLCLC